MFIFDERFAEAFFHKGTHRVMGRRLLPFSYWHKAQLEYQQSRILLGMPTLWDYWVASRVCSTQYPENVNLKCKYSAIWQICWHLRYGRRSLVREAEAFSAYLLEYASAPKLWGSGGGSKDRLSEACAHLGAITADRGMLQKAQLWAQAANADKDKSRDIDDSVEQVTIYMKNGARPPQEAWNLPLGKLLWYNACFLKMRGVEVPIWTPSDEEAFEKHKVVRQAKISALAEEILAAEPQRSSEVAMAQAAVQYWEVVVQNQERTAKR
jgi:hypothetical protein